MKCLIVSGSPSSKYRLGDRETGSFTSKLTEHAASVMNLMGEMEYAELKLSDVQIPSCTGCYKCFLYGEQFCPHAKQIQPIVALLRATDCFILTSPVYAMNVTGTLKNFLDHVSYFEHRPEFFGKKALVVSTCTDGGASKVTKYLAQTLGNWGFSFVYRLAIRRVGTVDPTPNMIEKVTKKAETLYEDAISEAPHQPTFKQLAHFSKWQKINASEEATEADGRYWREAGLLDGHYAPNISLNPFVKIASGVIRGVSAISHHIMLSRI